YQIGNRDKIREQCRRYRISNHDKIREQRRRYRIKNRDKIRERKRYYQTRNRDKIGERKRRYYIENRARFYDWRVEHRERINARRRAKNLFLRVLEEEFDPTPSRRWRTASQRRDDRRTLYCALLEEVGPEILTVLDELKQEELAELERANR